MSTVYFAFFFNGLLVFKRPYWEMLLVLVRVSLRPMDMTIQWTLIRQQFKYVVVWSKPWWSTLFHISLLPNDPHHSKLTGQTSVHPFSWLCSSTLPAPWQLQQTLVQPGSLPPDLTRPVCLYFLQRQTSLPHSKNVSHVML